MGLLTPAKLKELVSAAKAQKLAKQQEVSASDILNSKMASSELASNIGYSVNEPKQDLITKEATVEYKAKINETVSNCRLSADRSTLITTNKNVQTTAAAAGDLGRVINHPVTIQSLDGSKKQVLLPPNLYKMAKQGQIQAVNVVGKGVQLRINANAQHNNKFVMINVSKTEPDAASTALLSSCIDPSKVMDEKFKGDANSQTAAAATTKIIPIHSSSSKQCSNSSNDITNNIIDVLNLPIQRKVVDMVRYYI